MGYQESLIKVYDPKDFNKVVKYLQANIEELSDKGITPVTIVELKKDFTIDLGYMLKPKELVDFKAGEKLICITGERYWQQKIFEKDINLVIGTGIYFVECFPDDEMFKENSTLARETKFKEYVNSLEETKKKVLKVTR